MYRQSHKLACLVVLLLIPMTAYGGITSVLENPRFRLLGLAPIAPALANTVASTYPVASASSGITYEYDPTLDALVRHPVEEPRVQQPRGRGQAGVPNGGGTLAELPGLS